VSPRRILIVDDEQGIRAALGQLLEFEGYEVRSVANAVDGLAEYERFRPHLATMEKVLGGFLVLTGILFLTNSMTLIAGWILEMFPGLAKIG